MDDARSYIPLSHCKNNPSYQFLESRGIILIQRVCEKAEPLLHIVANRGILLTKCLIYLRRIRMKNYNLKVKYLELIVFVQKRHGIKVSYNFQLV